MSIAGFEPARLFSRSDRQTGSSGGPRRSRISRRIYPWRTQEEMGRLVILPKIRDPRFITVRRGGSLQDDDHRLLAMWAADCAEHVLHYFEQARPKDDRPR